MLRTMMIATLALAAPMTAMAPAHAAETTEMTSPVFEMFRLVPGKTEEFIRDMAIWDQVSAAGGQPATQLFLHAGGEGYDVLLYKPARPKPTAAQVAAMEAKRKELGLPGGAMYFIDVREKMADHIHFDATGPMTAADWVAQLERERAEVKKRK